MCESTYECMNDIDLKKGNKTEESWSVVIVEATNGVTELKLVNFSRSIDRSYAVNIAFLRSQDCRRTYIVQTNCLHKF